MVGPGSAKHGRAPRGGCGRRFSHRYVRGARHARLAVSQQCGAVGVVAATSRDLRGCSWFCLRDHGSVGRGCESLNCVREIDVLRVQIAQISLAGLCPAPRWGSSPQTPESYEKVRLHAHLGPTTPAEAAIEQALNAWRRDPEIGCHGLSSIITDSPAGFAALLAARCSRA